MNDFHVSVLLKESIEYLDVKKDGKYIDATLGGGGHTLEILKRGGKVLGIDVDQDAIDYVREKIKDQKSILIQSGSKIKDVEKRFILVYGNFKDIDEIARLAAKQAHLNNFENADGILFDLGVSSYQINTPERGFSLQKEGPLDMRMDKNLAVKAADLLNILTKGELYELFTKLGEERNARAISDNIIRSRGIKPIETTQELTRIIEESYGIKKDVSGKTRALLSSKVFQALRIAVNDELNNLKIALPKAISLLKTDGRLVVISFHSLEDRVVKNSFKEFEKKGLGEILTKKIVVPGLDEIKNNVRSRSAKLRAFKKN